MGIRGVDRVLRVGLHQAIVVAGRSAGKRVCLRMRDIGRGYGIMVFEPGGCSAYGADRVGR
jgi:hypothetical protein